MKLGCPVKSSPLRASVNVEIGDERKLQQCAQFDGPFTGPAVAELHIDQQYFRWSSCALRPNVSATSAVSPIAVRLTNRVRVPHRSQLRRSPGDFLFRQQPVAVAVSGRKPQAQVTFTRSNISVSSSSSASVTVRFLARPMPVATLSLADSGCRINRGAEIYHIRSKSLLDSAQMGF